MRTLTAAQSAVLAMAHRAHHIKVEIDRDGAGTWVDLGDLFGFPWVLGATWTEAIDQPVANATVSLRHRNHGLSLNPFMTSSPPNVGGVLVRPYRKLRISTATTGQYMTPAASDYTLVFRGRIWQVDWAGEVITCECRDEGGDLQDTWLEASKFYDVSAGIAVETLTQSVLSSVTNWGGTAVTLWSTNGTGGTPFAVADTPSWNVTNAEGFMQEEMSVLDAVRRFWCDQLGWDVRYKWQATAADFKLVAYEPVRSPAVDFTFSADSYTVEAAQMSNADVRNAVRVAYPKAGVQDGSTVTVTDATSITKYGRKFMQIAEDVLSQIDTSAEATDLANNILTDVMEPTINLTLRVPYFWPAQLNDYYTLGQNGVHFSSDQSLALQAVTHTFGSGMATSHLTLSGLPKTGLRGWTRKAYTNLRRKLGTPNVKHDVGTAMRNVMLTMWSRK